MQNLLQKGMYTFEIKWALRAKFGKDIGGLIFSFIDEPPKPWWCFRVVNPPSPWDFLMEPDDYINLPLFAP